MTPEEAERAIAGPVQRFGQRFMLDPTFYAPAIESGYQGYDFYVTGRGGVLGDVDADVVDQVERYVAGTQHLCRRSGGEVACPLRRVFIEQPGGAGAPRCRQVGQRVDMLLGPGGERGLGTELDDGGA